MKTLKCSDDYGDKCTFRAKVENAEKEWEEKIMEHVTVSEDNSEDSSDK